MKRIPVGWLHLAVVIALLAAPAGFSQSSDPPPLKIGFTKGLFVGRNENDILASMKVWAGTITQERGVNMDSDILLYPHNEYTVPAIQEKKVDAVTLQLSEYADFPEGLLSGPFIKQVVAGRTHQEFVILAPRKEKAWTINDLRGAKLSIHSGPDTDLALEWLNAQLAEAGLGSIEHEASRLDRNPKVSTSVLSVFFGKNDACLAFREGFKTMVELNPQVGQKIAVVASSDPIITSFFCFRQSLPRERKQMLAREITRLHESVTGRQVLRVFKANAMREVTEAELNRSLDLLNSWRQSVARPAAQQTEGQP